MKFSIGDIIVLKRTGEEGRVVSYLNETMVEVEVNGTIFPVYTVDVDHPYLKWFTEKKKLKKTAKAPEQLPVENIKSRPAKLARGIYLSFIPVFKKDEVEDIVDHLQIHLLNETPEPIEFSYDVQLLHESEFRHEGKLHAFGHLYLHNISYDNMNDQPRLHWRLVHAENRELAPAEDVLRIRPKKLFQHINEVLLQNTSSFSYLLIDEFKPKARAPKKEPKFIPPEPVRPSHFSKLLTDLPRHEIDLHIEQLVSSIQGLSNSDMLFLQLETLEKYLSLAIAARQNRMVIIHGIGKGVLKEEVHKILKQTPEVKRFANDWEAKYGYGATIVEFKY